MPKRKPDRDDRRGGLGLGGPQTGEVGRHESDGQLEAAGEGAGGQRRQGGSSRDPEQRQ